MKIFSKLVVSSQKLVAYKGFTLVELLIVIAVIGILATVLIVAVNPLKQLQKSRDTQRKTALKTMQSALEQYFADNGAYPVHVGCSSGSGCWNTFLPASYLAVKPLDPSANGTNCGSSTYGYRYVGTATAYTLTARLENTTDTQGQTGTVNGCNYGNSNNVKYSIASQQ